LQNFIDNLFIQSQAGKVSFRADNSLSATHQPSPYPPTSLVVLLKSHEGILSPKRTSIDLQLTSLIRWVLALIVTEELKMSPSTSQAVSAAVYVLSPQR
jgi:hypothetical protein